MLHELRNGFPMTRAVVFVANELSRRYLLRVEWNLFDWRVVSRRQPASDCSGRCVAAWSKTNKLHRLVLEFSRARALKERLLEQYLVDFRLGVIRHKSFRTIGGCVQATTTELLYTRWCCRVAVLLWRGLASSDILCILFPICYNFCNWTCLLRFSIWFYEAHP